MKKNIIRLLACILALLMLVGCSVSQGIDENGETKPVEPQTTPLTELDIAKELNIIPESWDEDFSATADFEGYSVMLEKMMGLCDKEAIGRYQSLINKDAFPSRVMRRDDGLILSAMAAEALDWIDTNCIDLPAYVENNVSYDLLYSQTSWDYPYVVDPEHEITTHYKVQSYSFDDVWQAQHLMFFVLFRRVDLDSRKTLLDDENYDYHLDGVLTREDAVKIVVRLYNSENAEYDFTRVNEPSEEDIKLLENAEMMKMAILENTDSLPCTGTAYYVSYNTGNDDNDGKTPQTAWKTLERVNTAELSSGDGVYFNRGELWRGQLWCASGVTYSAYGSGEKPKLYASPEDGAKSSMWKLLEGTDNIWVYNKQMLDCGNLVFNGGELYGFKAMPNYVDGYRSLTDNEAPFDVTKELTQNLMFFSKADSILYRGAPFRFEVMDSGDHNETEEVVGELYLRCDEGNPGDVFNSIEFLARQNIIVAAKDAVINNLCLKYTGGHGIYHYENYHVSFCEIGWIGGAIQYFDEDGIPIPWGNGVECGGNNIDNFSVEDCYIYQCFDAGASNQGGANIQKNILYARNLIEYSDMPIEIFISDMDREPDINNLRLENLVIEDNYLMYAGFGWASATQEYKIARSSGYQGWNHHNPSKDFTIRNNVFYLSTGPLLTTSTKDEWAPTLEGNTYVQTKGNYFISWQGSEGEQWGTMYVAESETIEDIMQNVLLDKTGTARVQ